MRIHGHGGQGGAIASMLIFGPRSDRQPLSLLGPAFLALSVRPFFLLLETRRSLPVPSAIAAGVGIVHPLLPDVQDAPRKSAGSRRRV
jgi:hypothetical protein